MLEHLKQSFNIISRDRPSSDGLLKLCEEREVDPGVVELYGEISRADFEGPGPRYFRFWSPTRVLEVDSAYNVSSALPGALPIGSDGGGNLIVIRNGRVFSVGYGAVDEDELVPLAPSLAEFLQHPEPLWPWIEDDPR